MAFSEHGIHKLMQYKYFHLNAQLEFRNGEFTLEFPADSRANLKNSHTTI